MDTSLSYGKDYHFLPITSVQSGKGHEVSSDLYCYTIQIVNIVFIGTKDNWVLVDAGMPKSAPDIISTAEKRFGNSKPKCIILTHGHFDHVGAIIELIKHWDIPVYAHELELPYLTGKQSYPNPDPSVEGGLLAKTSFLYPIEPITLGSYVHPLPANGTIPLLTDWRWIHTPGHTRGHISLFREKDHALIAGDAFINVKQDSLYKVLTQTEEISGPPRYLTTDWKKAKQSVLMLQSLQPHIAITGHGLPLSGVDLSGQLDNLVAHFDEHAIPDYGKYLEH
ncbi:MBL fold metallo-hydrolase [Bacillus horti]|uniref:Glyoxylase-like metal-dependent hydrolase (Beta-lactamase superfamily II) n=1 Tax=Caldalkalibacillus horti TaxID=77523 RepID=A0ABT9VXP7_9BACI|nr:MBL fold metallo-hydrolase [Bacillus horti]MDQ0165587.1 glyoxylase-like metal-dependent hydrolase (beta-lactamase superfamily II) [Bacillus horti]